MEQNKKDILKKKVANMAPTPGQVVGGMAKSAFNGVKNAISGAASTVSGALKEKFGPAHYQRQEPIRTSIPFPKTPKSLPPLTTSEWKSNNPAYNKAVKNNTLGRGWGEPAGAAPALKKLVKKASK